MAAARRQRLESFEFTTAGRLLIKAAHADVVSHGVLHINQTLLASSRSLRLRVSAGCRDRPGQSDWRIAVANSHPAPVGTNATRRGDVPGPMIFKYDRLGTKSIDFCPDA